MSIRIAQQLQSLQTTHCSVDSFNRALISTAFNKQLSTNSIMFEKYKSYAQPLARYGIGIVFLLFGIIQFTNVSSWSPLIPDFLTYFMSKNTILIFISIFNFCIGTLLILGTYVRIASFLGALHLIGVIFVLGFNPIAVRDFGLLLVTISILFNGPDPLCIKK